MFKGNAEQKSRDVLTAMMRKRGTVNHLPVSWMNSCDGKTIQASLHHRHYRIAVYYAGFHRMHALMKMCIGKKAAESSSQHDLTFAFGMDAVTASQAAHRAMLKYCEIIPAL